MIDCKYNRLGVNTRNMIFRRLRGISYGQIKSVAKLQGRFSNICSFVSVEWCV